jgi:hypothetical protein
MGKRKQGAAEKEWVKTEHGRLAVQASDLAKKAVRGADAVNVGKKNGAAGAD